ncbi:lipase 3-like [Plodia interpunctella]|uniref:lipase 3-like n=1 Tax=Plodia interpunctella TaxID=58824 RepID=UPI002367849D|nr:lipase 3-like [Plodia interpunctella]
MFCLLLTCVLVAAASAGRSPHADYVEEYLKAKGAGRYSDNIIEDALLDIPELVAKYGYPFEAHSVTTTDAYILEVHRIPHGRDQNNTPNPNKPVAFLMHGLYSSSADFIVLGPGSALAYLLAEAGFDVWLGNARGNYYSRRHQTLNPDGGRRDLDFWRFSWDEIGNLDLPVVIDYVIATTGQPKLHYIGHSQGGTTFLVLNSLNPEYNEKFHSFQALAPAAFFIYNEDPSYRILAPLEAVLEDTLFALGVVEILGNREFFTWFSVNFCVDGVTADFCNEILYRGDPEFYNTTMTPLLLGHAPAGASILQMIHYGQSINSKKFRRFNYLPIKNIEVYGRPTPPDYDLNRVTVPTYLHYGYADLQADYRDINYLGDMLPNVAGRIPVPRESFNHLDFIWGIDAKAQLYDKLIEIMFSYH